MVAQQRAAALEAEALQSTQHQQEAMQTVVQEEHARMQKQVEHEREQAAQSSVAWQKYVSDLQEQFQAREAASQKSMQEQAQQYVSGMQAHMQAMEAKYQAELQEM